MQRRDSKLPVVHLVVLVLVFLSACEEISSSSTSVLFDEENRTGQVASTPTIVSTLNIETTPSPETSASPTPEMGPVDSNKLPPGLLYTTEQDQGTRTLWIVGESGKARRLVQDFHTSEFHVSADGHGILYVTSGDVWLLDISSGSIQNVTQTPDRVEQYPRWGPGSEDVITFASRVGLQESAFAAGYLTLMELDSNQYVVLDEGEFVASSPAPSRTNKAIAYTRARSNPDDRQPNLWIYEASAGLTRLELASFGLLGIDTVYDVSWSPSNDWLGIAAFGTLDGKEQAAIVLLDMVQHTAKLLHTFQPDAIGGALVNSAPIWLSQESTEVIFFVLDAEAGGQIWFSDGDDTKKLFADVTQNEQLFLPSASLDGKWIAAHDVNGNMYLLNRMTNQIISPNTPGRVVQTGWTDVP